MMDAPGGHGLIVTCARFFIHVEHAARAAFAAAIGGIGFNRRLWRIGSIVVHSGRVAPFSMVRHAKIDPTHFGTRPMPLPPIRSRQHAGWRVLASLMMCVALGGCSMAQRSTPATRSPYRVIGYDKAMGSEIRPGDVERIDVLIFAFARVLEGYVVLDPSAQQRLLNSLRSRQSHPRLKVVLSVGGWKSGGFSEAAATPETRQRFADSAVALMLANHADGLDVDWEYPGHHESGIVSSARRIARISRCCCRRYACARSGRRCPRPSRRRITTR
jgi:hypothetical protein